MRKSEVQLFMKKIKTYYPNFSLEDYVIDEWCERLKPYEKEDVENKFEEHLKGERAEHPPMLHFITRYLRTKEEKEKAQNDYLIRCNLCGEEMYLSDYDKTHYEKCLLIKSLIITLKEKKNEDISYQELDEYDLETLNKIYDKYHPKIIKDVSELWKK